MKKNIVMLFIVLIISLIIISTEKKETTTVIINVDNQKMNMEEYMCNVIMHEMKDHDNKEALKAFCIVVRSNLIRNYIYKGKYVLNESKDEKLIDEIFSRNSQKEKNKKSKVMNAIHATKGQIITYKGKVINVPYHKISIGKTLNKINNKEIPYLKSVDCLEDIESKDYLRITYYNADKLELLNKQRNDNLLEYKMYSVEKIDNKLRVVTKGIGHSYGMSLYNANCMGIKGMSYDKIINEFYRNVKIVKVY